MSAKRVGPTLFFGPVVNAHKIGDVPDRIQVVTVPT